MSATTDDQFTGGSLFDFSDATAEAEAGDQPIITIHVKSFPENFVREHDKVLFNTNNHQDYEVDPDNHLVLRKRPQGKLVDPEDYAAHLAECRTEKWIDLFHTHYRVINIPRHHLAWMKTASVVACQKAGMSPAFKEDVADAVRTIPTGNTFSSCVRGDPTTGYFVRTDTVSLKDGIHGAGPYYGLGEMLESSITARMGHQGVDGATSHLKYYLFPWKTELHTCREFRVFVSRRRVTAISQQSLYTANSILSSLAARPDLVHTVVQNWVRRLLPYIENVVLTRITWMDDFVMDIVLLGPPPPPAEVLRSDASAEKLVDVVNPEALVPYFIEVNPFGFAYSSGSSLFQWVTDYALLYGLEASVSDKTSDMAARSSSKRQAEIHFRFTAAPEANAEEFSVAI